MPHPLENQHRFSTGQNWKAYQEKLQRTSRNRYQTRTALRVITAVVVICIGIYGLFFTIKGFARHRPESSESRNKLSIEGIQPNTPTPDPLQNKKLARNMIEQDSFVNLVEEGFTMEADGKRLSVDTSIEAPLQRYMLKKMDRVNSRFIGIVAADPTTGRVLLLSGFNKKDPAHDPCLDNQYPAASIFKIVTAAAAVEQCGLTSGSKLRFNGSAHTLYKRQLKDANNKYTNHITFRDSFARSINPVFGKLGTHDLKKARLEQYAENFGFNQTIDFEIELPPSISETPYHWAEIASGFNHGTTISPLHGVLMAGAVVNEGQLMAPSIIDTIRDESGKKLYRASPQVVNKAVAPETARVLHDLMEATVRKGTARKTFRGYQKDKILSRLNIGGKTGSIFNRKHDLRFDWFVGFAEERQGEKKLAVSIVVAHEEYIGIRAGQYARMVIKKYFQNYFNHGEQAKKS